VVVEIAAAFRMLTWSHDSAVTSAKGVSQWFFGLLGEMLPLLPIMFCIRRYLNPRSYSQRTPLRGKRSDFRQRRVEPVT